jgi:hypothetical protein
VRRGVKKPLAGLDHSIGAWNLRTVGLVGVEELDLQFDQGLDPRGG